ncbi:hypothetical protein [Paenarthrobacter sp. YJN-D]|uniref:hypothetical protein n=1 Tax=Paenarthrobacter sp. YJN-D TaxID=2735317 RepID=UPI001878C49A|nr:hypothetical protein [Paenarthrobacter sp. YJN-D]QOT22726.1 hypothetical protein HMI60_14950 [Paenarthrobacter sp. YJN-D]
MAMSVQLDLDDHWPDTDQAHAVAAVARVRRSAPRSPLLSSDPAWLPRFRRRNALGAQRQVLLVTVSVQLDLDDHGPGTDLAHAGIIVASRDRRSSPSSPLLSSDPAWLPRSRRRNARGAQRQVLLVAMSVQLDLDDHGPGTDQGHAGIFGVCRVRRSAPRSL